MTTTVQKRNILQPGKSIRKGGYINLKENLIIKTEFSELCENDDISDSNSLNEMPVSKQRVIYENSYKMAPDILFPVNEVERTIHEVLEENLAKEIYDLNRSRDFCKEISHQMIQLIAYYLHLINMKIKW